MGTWVHLVADAGSSEELQQAEALIRLCEQRWSRFLPTSELQQINAAAGHPTIVDPVTFDLLETACQAWAATSGAFDPTVGTLMSKNGYDRSFAQLTDRPTSTAWTRERTDRAERATPDQIERNRSTSTVILPPGTALDFGGIAKGFTADLVARELLVAGISGCCVSIGGDVRVEGIGPEDGVWCVDLEGVEDLHGRRARVRLRSGAVCTSTTTKRVWHNESGTHHHLLDPRTGTSRTDCPTTVVAIAASATAAEVISKWMMAGGEPAHFEATGVSVSTSGAQIETVRHPGFERYEVTA